MLYENVETYLNEEVRKPIKELIADKKTRKEVMKVVDYLCDKYREMNGLALFYERRVEDEKNAFKEWMEFASKNDIYRNCDYDNLPSPFDYEEEYEDE